MCSSPSVGLFLLLLSCSGLLPSSHALLCWMNAKDDFNQKQPLLLQANSNEFLYPQKCNSKDLKLKFLDNLRVACPDDNLVVSTSNLNISEANLRCYGLSFFEVAGQQFPTEIEQIACARSPVADAVRTESSCPNGTIARVGFGLASSAFLPTIEQICHNETLAQTHWAKSRIVMSVRKRQLESPTAPLYKTGEFYQNLTDVPRAYTRDAQRMRLQDLLNDTTVVDKYIPANGDEYLVEGMLAPWADMFYRTQQESTYYYINTVPIWKSIQKSNWKLVEDITRKIAGQQCTNLEVWTGGIDTLTLKNSMGNDTEITLTTTEDGNSTAIPVPKFLFKYVVDQVHNRGIVFVTLNNPRVNAITPDDQLCEARTACSSLYPQFGIVSMGFTYCCSIDANSKFAPIAARLGLPSFPNAQPLV